MAAFLLEIACKHVPQFTKHMCIRVLPVSIRLKEEVRSTMANRPSLPPRTRHILTMDDYAARVAERAMSCDWVERHELLRMYMKTRLKEYLPSYLSPCQSIYGRATGVKPAAVIPLREYGSSDRAPSPPRKQRCIWQYFKGNDRESWLANNRKQ